MMTWTNTHSRKHKGRVLTLWLLLGYYREQPSVNSSYTKDMAQHSQNRSTDERYSSPHGSGVFDVIIVAGFGISTNRKERRQSTISVEHLYRSSSSVQASSCFSKALHPGTFFCPCCLLSNVFHAHNCQLVESRAGNSHVETWASRVGL